MDREEKLRRAKQKLAKFQKKKEAGGSNEALDAQPNGDEPANAPVENVDLAAEFGSQHPNNDIGGPWSGNYAVSTAPPPIDSHDGGQTQRGRPSTTTSPDAVKSPSLRSAGSGLFGNLISAVGGAVGGVYQAAVGDGNDPFARIRSPSPTKSNSSRLASVFFGGNNETPSPPPNAVDSNPSRPHSAATATFFDDLAASSTDAVASDFAEINPNDVGFPVEDQSFESVREKSATPSRDSPFTPRPPPPVGTSSGPGVWWANPAIPAPIQPPPTAGYQPPKSPFSVSQPPPKSGFQLPQSPFTIPTTNGTSVNHSDRSSPFPTSSPADTSSSNLQKALSDAQQQLQDSESRRTQLEDQVSHLTAQVNQVRHKLELEDNAQHAAIEGIYASLEQAQRRQAEVEEELGRVVGERDEAWRAVEELRVRLDEVQRSSGFGGGYGEFDAREAELRRREEEIASREAELRERERGIVEGSFAIGGHSAGLGEEEVAGKMRELEDEYAQLEEEREMVAAASAAVNAGKVQLEADKAAVEKSRAEVEKTQKEVESEKERVERSVAEKESRVKEKQDRLEKERRKVQEEKSALDAATKQIETDRSNLTLLQQQLDLEKSTLAAQKASLASSASSSEANATLEAETRKLTELRAQVEGERGTLREKEAELRRLIEEFERDKISVREEKEKVEDLRREAESAKRQVEVLKSQVAEREERVKRQAEEAASKRGEVGEESDKVFKERAAIETARRNLEVEKAKLEIEKASVAADAARVKSEGAALGEREAKIKRFADEVGREKGVVDEGRIKLERERRELESERKSVEEGKRRLESERAQFGEKEGRYRELMEQLLARQASVQEESRRVEEAKIRLERERGQVENDRAEVLEKERSLREREAEVLAGRGVADEEARAVQDLRRQCEVARVQVEEERSRLLRREKEHEHQVEEWARRISSINEESSRVAERSRQLEVEKITLLQRESEARTLKEEMETKQRELEGTIRGFHEMKMQLEGRIAEREKHLGDEKREVEEERRRGREREARERGEFEEFVRRERTKLEAALREVEETKVRVLKAEEEVKRKEKDIDEKAIKLSEEMERVEVQRGYYVDALSKVEESQRRLDRERAELRVKEEEVARKVAEVEVKGVGVGVDGGVVERARGLEAKVAELVGENRRLREGGSLFGGSAGGGGDAALVGRVQELEKMSREYQGTILKLHEALETERRTRHHSSFSIDPYNFAVRHGSGMVSPSPGSLASSSRDVEERLVVLERKLERRDEEILGLRRELEGGGSRRGSVVAWGAGGGGVGGGGGMGGGVDLGNLEGKRTDELLSVISMLSSANQQLMTERSVRPVPLPTGPQTPTIPSLPLPTYPLQRPSQQSVLSSRSQRSSIVLPRDNDRGYMSETPYLEPRSSKISQPRGVYDRPDVRRSVSRESSNVGGGGYRPPARERDFLSEAESEWSDDGRGAVRPEVERRVSSASHSSRVSVGRRGDAGAGGGGGVGRSFGDLSGRGERGGYSGGGGGGGHLRPDVGSRRPSEVSVGGRREEYGGFDSRRSSAVVPPRGDGGNVSDVGMPGRVSRLPSTVGPSVTIEAARARYGGGSTVSRPLDSGVMSPRVEPMRSSASVTGSSYQGLDSSRRGSPAPSQGSAYRVGPSGTPRVGPVASGGAAVLGLTASLFSDEEMAGLGELARGIVGDRR
ncbi:hypothetical protein HDV00_004891 [Rhizophlyctis rosea]|nr:hypothetical protein HDV00_004891 [Rhizophlyctis rosea]